MATRRPGRPRPRERRYHPVKALLEEYAPRVYRFALRLSGSHQDAEDLVQETFLRAWRHRGRVREAGAVRVWLFTIAANVWRDHLRRRKRRPEVQGAIADDCQARASPPDGGLIAQEDQERLTEAMDRLPPRQREVLHLHAWEQLSLAEIAQVLDISPDAAKASLSLARRRMRELFDARSDKCPSCGMGPSDEQTWM
jgi:RNA polymerase sigma-70 factor, ECF subfamily